jgi:lantibiotic modifying enzyme
MWNPIIDGTLRAEIFEKIELIAADIQKVAGPTIADVKRKSAKVPRTSKRDLSDSAASATKPGKRKEIDASLASGSAGLAILFAYLDQARSGYGDKQTALYFLERAMDVVSAVPMSSSFYGGVAGVAWTIAHLRRSEIQADGNATEAFDQLLRKALSRRRWRGAFDLIVGLAGLGVYSLEQLPIQSAVACLSHVVDRLGEIAERTPDGITWFTLPELLPDWQREACPNGYYDLGIAHGMPGVVAFLAQVCALDEQKIPNVTKVRTKARPMLEGAVAWLLAQKVADNADSVFPGWIEPGNAPTTSRVAWCYGDLGIAAALLAAANSVNNANWKREAVRLARHVARRSFAQSGVKDCGLCHGAAGVGHLFNRMFQETGDMQLKHAARGWFRRTLEMRQPAQGIAGFAAFQLDHWSNEIGILDGAAGIALALLAAVTPIEPEWDRMLLLSLPHSV